MPSAGSSRQLLRLPAARRVVGLATVGAFALSVAACGGGGTDAEQSSAETKTLVTTVGEATGDVDHIDWGLPYGEPDTIVPSSSTYYSSMFTVAQMCDTLVRLQPDHSTKPGLAEVTQPNPKTIEIALRKGVKFWNGNEMTSEDVRYSLERTTKDPHVESYFTSVKSIDATDKYHVTVKLKAPDVLPLKQLSNFSGMVVEKKFAEKAGDAFGSSDGGIMCSGPFKLRKWNPGTSIELEANPDYWDPEFKPHAKTASLKFFNDSTALGAALASGEIDGAYEVPAQLIPKLSSSDAGTLNLGPSLLWMTLGHAQPGGTLKDGNLRRALFMTIDRKALADQVFHGAAHPSYTNVTPNMWDPEAKDVWAEAYRPFEEAGKKFGTPEGLDEAKKLVEQSGYDGTPVVLTTLAGDVTMSNIAQLIQQQASDIGIKVKIDALPSIQYAKATYDATARKGSDLLLASYFAMNPEPLEFLPFQTTPGLAYNYSEFDDPEVTKLLDRARRTLDAKERAALQVQAQAILEKDPHWASPVYQDEISFLNKRLSGMTTSFAYAFTPSLARIGAAGAGAAE